jgi:hypothetical protein
MKAVAAPRKAAATLTIQIDPLAVPRGHRALPRGGAHATARRPSRARGKAQWRRQLQRDDAEGSLR